MKAYLVLSEQVQVADAYESNYANYPAYRLTYTNSYDGSNTAADLPLSFSHWLETVSDISSVAAKQVMVYANTLNATTTNRVGTAVQPARQLPDGAELAIEDLFGNVLPLSDDNSSLSIYQEAESNTIAGVQLSGYEVQLESVGLYQLTDIEPDQVSAIDPDLTYIIGDQLVLDLTFNAELQETTYEPSQDFFLTLRFNDSASKEHVLGDGAVNPSIAGDIDQRYWYNSSASAYDDNDGDGNSSRADYEANIASSSSGFNNVLRYIFTIPEGASFNSLEEGVVDPNLSITGLSFSDGLVDGYGSRVDTAAVVAALSAVSLPIKIDSIRPQIQLSSTGTDYVEIAEFTTYSRDDYFKYLTGNVSQYPDVITFTLSFTEPIVMPAQSGVVESGESNFTSGLRFELSDGERIAASAYVPYAGTGSAPEYTTTIFTYSVASADDSGISAIDINATIYDLAGNPNYYSGSPDNNDTQSSLFASALYTGILLDGHGPAADIAVADDVRITALQPNGTSLVADASAGTYGVGTTLYFEVRYDQNIHTNNLSGAASDIRLVLQSTSGGNEVAASIIDSQLNSYATSGGSTNNRDLTFSYTLSADDESNASGYLVHSLRYDDSGFARYGILDAYGNGINSGAANLNHKFADLNITTGAIDTVMPYIADVSILDASGNLAASDILYGNGDTITFALTFSEQVSRGQSSFESSPNGLRFKIDSLVGDDAYRIASFSNQSAEQTFTFTYVVGSVAGENDKGDVYLNDITLLGDTYDLALNLETDLSYSGPGGAANDSGHDVDSGAPIVTALSIEYQEPNDLYEAIQEGTAYTLGIGTAVRFSLTFDEAISFDVNSTGAVVPYLELKAVDSAIATPQRIRAELTAEANATIGNGYASSLAFSFVIGSGAGDNNLSSDNNATQQSLYNYLEVFALRNADQIQDSATNVLSSSADYALTGDAFATIHNNGVDSEPDIFGDTLIHIDSVRPQITLLELDKTSSETYGAGEEISLSISFSEALNASALDSAAPLSQVAMRLERTEPDFVDANRSIFAYTFSKQSSSTSSNGTSVEYLLTSTSPGTVFDVNSSGELIGTSSSAGNFVNFAYEGEITGDYTLTGDIRDLGGNYIDPADLNISTNGSSPSPSSLTAVSPTAFVDHLAPRPLATTIRRSGGGTPTSNSNPPYKLGDVFVFTITFHEDLSLVNHDNNLGNLQLDLDFDVQSTDRSVALGDIPSGDPSKLYFTYTVSAGDQALDNDHTLALFGFSKASGYNSLAIVDAHGNQVDPESIDFATYDLDGDGSVFDANSDGIVDSGDEEFDILQPDYDLLIDGVAPYWVSISSSSAYSRPYALSAGESIAFTLTASEALSPSETGMQLLLDLQPENANLDAPQIRSVGGAFYGSDTSNDSTDDDYSVITFTYTVGSDNADAADSVGSGIDHLALMASSSYQYGSIISQDLASNPIPEHNFSLIDGFIVFPEDENLSSNRVKFDTTSPIVESVAISGFDANNLAITNTRISFTLQFQDDDLDTVSIDANRSEINLTILDLSTDYDVSSSTDAALTLHQINADSLVFAGALPERIDWSGALSLEIADANSLITDKAIPANGMVSESILGSGADDLNATYTIDTAPPRIANLHEIDSTLYTPITTSGVGYGPGRQATFMVTFNEELAAIGGSQSSTAKLQFFIYDDIDSTANARALRLRTAAASGGSAELPTIEDADGNKRSVAYFYYTVNTEDDPSLDDYDGGSIYMNFADTTTYPTASSGEYARCYDDKVANATNCYFALDGQLKDINNNTSTFTVSDSADWVYAFNRTNPPSTSREPQEITRFVTDPLEIIGYKIRVTPTDDDRAWGYDYTSVDNTTATAGKPTIETSVDQPYIGASETEDASGNPGSIYFLIEPGAEEFLMDTTTPDVNLTFSIADAQDAEYVASYYASDSEYITFAFDIANFKQDYNSNLILHSVSQNAGMTYSDNSGVFVLADTKFYPSADLDNSYPVEDQQFDTGLLLDMAKPELLSVVAYRESTAGSGVFDAPIDTTVDSNPYFGRDDEVVFRFSFSENLGAVNVAGGNAQILLSLELDSGTITVGQGTPTEDDRTITSDDFDTFDVTYTVADVHAGSINNDYLVLDAIVSDINGNTITGDDLNISRTISGFISPLVNGDYAVFSAVNIYRRVNLSSADSEVYSPIPDIANGISDYTLIGGDNLYIAATFTYTLDALQDVYPDFQATGYGGSNANGGNLESNYSFSSQITGKGPFIAEYNASFSDSDLSSDGANVLLFSYDVNESNDSADSGFNYLLLEGLTGLGNADQIRDIYGNPTSSFIPDDAEETVTRIDSTAPTLIGVSHAVADGQPLSKTNYGPLDSNISFALTFDEVIDIDESFKTLQLTFYIGDSSSGSYSARTLRQGTTIAQLEEAIPEPNDIYEAGQIVNMVYFLNSNDYGTIDVNATDASSTSYPLRISAEIYDHHNGTKGNKATLSAEVNNSSDSNSDIYIPVLNIDQTAIKPSRWAIEASDSASQPFIPHGSTLLDGVVWESNSTNITARVGIGNTLSFIIDYVTEIRDDSLYLDSDTTGSAPVSIVSGENNVSLLFTSRSYDLEFYAPIADVAYDQSSNTSSLIFTYDILASLDLELDGLSFEGVIIPEATTVRSSAFNEIIISGADFDQSTSAMIDAIYPQISSIDVYAPTVDVFTDLAADRKYFGEDDNITFRVTFSEQLIDTDTTDTDPDFALSWTILDDADSSSTMRYFDSSATSITAADVSHSSGSQVYNLVFPVELENNLALTARDYQGLIQFSASSPTKVFTDSTGVIQDLAQNSQQSFTYSVTSDFNASTNNNYAVDFIRPRLQYIESHSTDSSVSSNSYTQYQNASGGEALTHYYGGLDLSFYVVHDSALALASSNLPELNLSVPTASGADAEFTLNLYSNSIATWPTLADGGTVNKNALAFEFDIAAASATLSSDTFEGVVSFAEILQATSYFDEPGNYAYFQLVNNGTVKYVYADGNLSLDGYIPSVDSLANHEYPMPTIYIDTTPPVFNITGQQQIELTNRALVFNLTLAQPLSELELSGTFNNNPDSSYHSAPTYTISWQNANGGTDSYSGLLYDGSGGADDGTGTDTARPFAFTLFSDAGTNTLTADGQARRRRQLRHLP